MNLCRLAVCLSLSHLFHCYLCWIYSASNYMVHSNKYSAVHRTRSAVEFGVNCNEFSVKRHTLGTTEIYARTTTSIRSVVWTRTKSPSEIYFELEQPTHTHVMTKGDAAAAETSMCECVFWRVQLFEFEEEFLDPLKCLRGAEKIRNVSWCQFSLSLSFIRVEILPKNVSIKHKQKFPTKIYRVKRETFIRYEIG